jgi:hypothetical protein
MISADELAEPTTPAEKHYVEVRDVGYYQVYTPDTSLETLRGFGPAVATDSNPLGKVETVMSGLRSLAFRAPYEPRTHQLLPREIHHKMAAGRVYLFSNMEDKAAVEEMRGKPIPGPDDVVKETILANAVRGEFEAPKFAEISDPVGVARSVHRLSGTWGPTNAKKFEEKLVSLLPAARKDGGGTNKNQVKAKA